MIKKKCSKCGVNKKLIEFNKNKAEPHGVGHYCKGCIKKEFNKYVNNNRDEYREKQREKQKKWRKKNPERNKRNSKKWINENPEKHKQHCIDGIIKNRLRKQKLKEELVKYKGGKCKMCGYNKCNDALDFHHIDPSNKEFTISQKIHKCGGTTIDALKKEADKCILLCRNCHAEVGYKTKILKQKQKEMI